MIKISDQNTMPAGALKRSAEASELGMPPGKWPATLQVEPGFGNGLPLGAIQVERDAEQTVTSVLYQQDMGCLQLVVFND